MGFFFINWPTDGIKNIICNYPPAPSGSPPGQKFGAFLASSMGNLMAIVAKLKNGKSPRYK